MSNICWFTVPASRDLESIIDYVAGNSSLGASERLRRENQSKVYDFSQFS